jgi:Tol biopolymer transport system component
MTLRSTILAFLAATALGDASARAADTPPLPYLQRQLAPDGEPASRVAGWAVDPRGEWIAFIGDTEFAGAEAVYSMRRNGTTIRRLSAYGAVGAISQVDFSADGRRVVYRGDLEVDGRQEIWSVAPWSAAAAAVKLNVAVVGAGAGIFRVPATGSRIVYRAERAGGVELWSVPAEGPAANGARLDPPAIGDEDLLDFEIRPDGAALLVQFLDPTALTGRIFTLPIAGPAGSAVLLAGSEEGECVPVWSRWAPDSSRLVYAGLCPTASGVQPTQIWSVPAGGPAEAAVSLAGSFATGGVVQSIVISPDSTRLVFTADRLVDERRELFSVPLAGPAAAMVRLNPTLVANGDVVANPAISPDSARVAYIADQVSDERYFPYSVPIDGSSAAITLYQGILMTSADAKEVAFTPDSSRVVFRFDLAVDERFDLYQAPTDGSSAQARITNRGSSPAPGRSVAWRWYVHPDGDRVIYLFDESTPADERGIGEQRFVDPYPADLRLNGIPAAGGNVNFFRLFPDAAGVVYRSDQDVNDKFELFSADLRIFGDGFEEGTTAAWGDL